MKTEILYDNDVLGIERAAEIIKDGGLVAFPTETVYGLGANALDETAVKKIFEAKGRPQDNPLIIHLAYPEDAGNYAFANGIYDKLKRFMPGPLTVILKKRDNIPSVVSAGLDTVAVRIPSYEPARALIKASGVPIAAPSANISGKPSPTKAEHVISDMDGRIDAVLCGSDCEVGVESTIVKITGEDSLVICRPGGITKEMLSAVCGKVEIDPAVLSKFDGKPIAPGMKYKHYAPRAEVTVLVGDEESIESFLTDKENYGIMCYDEDKALLKHKYALSLGRADDKSEQAARLFACLREFDKNEDIDKIYARMPEKDGVGLAVYNRLIKAAGFKVIEL